MLRTAMLMFLVFLYELNTVITILAYVSLFTQLASSET